MKVDMTVWNQFVAGIGCTDPRTLLGVPRKVPYERLGTGFVGYFPVLKSLQFEFPRLHVTKEIHLQIHFDGVTPFESSHTQLQVLSGLVTYPNRSRPFPIQPTH